MSETPGIYLWADSLLSKWGFNDGDMPDHIYDACDEHGIRYELVDWDTVLRNLVRKHLLPELEKHHTVEVFDIETIHNPIRAASVDGVKIDDYSTEHEVELTPECVVVSMGEVIAEIRRVVAAEVTE